MPDIVARSATRVDGRMDVAMLWNLIIVCSLLGDIAVKNAPAVRANIYSSVDARITGNTGVAVAPLVSVVIDADPGGGHVVGTEDASPVARKHGEDRRIILARCGLAEAHLADR